MSTEITICALNELDDDTPERFELRDPTSDKLLKLAVIKSGDKVYVVDDTCTHANFSLSTGEFDKQDLTLECSKHGALFSLVSGEPLCLPATRPIRVYDSFIESGEVKVRLDDE